MKFNREFTVILSAKVVENNVFGATEGSSEEHELSIKVYAQAPAQAADIVSRTMQFIMDDHNELKRALEQK